MDRREGAGRYRAMQSIMDWNRSRLAYRTVKRAFDIVFSGCVLAVIAVPSLVLAAAIRLESEGNPFYSQIRVGQTHRDGSLSTFRMWKFRSMYRDADERLAELREQNEIAGAMFKMKEDPRVTRIGRFIRKHSIDEFPQFLNVFLGQMSVVGPRPPLPNEVEQYTEFDLQRLAVKPGITGWWQVTDRNSTGFDGMVRRDLEYIARRGPVTDLKIIVLTVIEVITGKGACYMTSLNNRFESEKKMKIAVAGTGYVGLSLAVLLSQHNEVHALDIVPEKVEKINNYESPIQDDEIERFLAEAKAGERQLDLHATVDVAEAYTGADYAVIATPTNYDSDRNFFDTSSVEAAIAAVRSVNPDAWIVIKSTIPVGYTAGLRERLGDSKIFFSPEFLRESKALYDNLHPSRIVVGAPKDDPEAVAAAEEFAGLLAQGADPVLALL